MTVIPPLAKVQIFITNLQWLFAASAYDSSRQQSAGAPLERT
jgi:hypothetical protein